MDGRLDLLDRGAHALVHSEDDSLARGHTEDTGRDALVEGCYAFRSPHVAGDSEDSLQRRLARNSGGFLEN